jgi:hypothetical protein
VTIYRLPCELIVIVPNRVPFAVGANWILIAQEEPAVTEAGQLLELVKSPVVEMPDTLSSAAPLFARFNCVAALVVATR